jgi:hypothetical protein
MVLADIGLGELLWSLLVIFVMITYFMMLFSIVVDVFRNPAMGGGTKALWCIVLLFFPLVSMLIYLIVNGNDMADRSVSQMQAQDTAARQYIRDAAGGTPADDIAKAKALLDDGVIDAEEFARLKQKALV